MYAPLQYAKKNIFYFVTFVLEIFVEAILLTCIIFSVSLPYREFTSDGIQDEGVDIALVLDISASMQAADFKPNRLQALKQITADFIKKSANNRVGIFAFAEDVFTQSPFSTDHEMLLELNEGLSFESIDHSISGGTNIGDALLFTADSLLKIKTEKRDQVIILITDGENYGGVDPLTAVDFLRTNQIRLYVIGIGQESEIEVYVNGKPFITAANTILKTSLKDESLIEIARRANGRYYRAGNENILASIFSEIATLEKTPLKIHTKVKRTYYTPDIALALFLLFTIWLLLRSFNRRPLR